MSAVTLENVSCRFGDVTAVDSVSLDIRPGEFVTLLGPSGCGKTTLLRMVAGLENGTGGRIAIDGTVVSDAERGWFLEPDRRRLGMVFQSYAIWPHMTVFDNVAYPLRVRRRSRDEIEEGVARALRLVEMSQYAQRPAPALSGGQQQRVAIARALAFEPRVLLLDEPLSNLDARLRLQMGEEFRALQQRLGITSLYVTHDQEEAMALSDRVVVMQSGRILQEAAPRELYRRPHSRAVAAFFGSPNLLEAQVVGAVPAPAQASMHPDDGGAMVWHDVRGRGWSAHVPAARPFDAGETVAVLVRPESLTLRGAAAPGGALAWAGRVAQSVFRGARQSIVVETEWHAFNLDVPAGVRALPGDNVHIGVPSSEAWIVSV